MFDGLNELWLVTQKMLEEGNAAMVDLARDYKRQQAIIERYRLEDNSLQSFSQLTQSQPTKQQQQQQQQLQQHQQHQQEQQQLQPLQQLQLLKPPPATPLATTPLQACRAVDGGVRDEGGDDGAVDEDGAADAKSSLDALLECSQGSATFVSFFLAFFFLSSGAWVEMERHAWIGLALSWGGLRTTASLGLCLCLCFFRWVGL